MPTGVFYPNKVQVTPFISNVYRNKGILFVDILRIILIILILFIYIYDNIKVITLQTIIKSWTTLLTFIILGLILVLFCLKLIYLNKDESIFFLDKQMTYQDTYYISKMYKKIMLCECILLILLIIKMVKFTQLFEIYTLLFSSMAKTLVMFFQFVIITIIALLGLAAIAKLIWGSYLKEYKTFGLSFISVLLFTSGYYSSSELINYDDAWGIIFMIVFFLVQLFFFLAIFLALFAESLRRSVKEYGYPEDYKIKKWGKEDYKIWALHFPSYKKDNDKIKND